MRARPDTQSPSIPRKGGSTVKSTLRVKLVGAAGVVSALASLGGICKSW